MWCVLSYYIYQKGLHGWTIWHGDHIRSHVEHIRSRFRKQDMGFQVVDQALRTSSIQIILRPADMRTWLEKLQTKLKNIYECGIHHMSQFGSLTYAYVMRMRGWMYATIFYARYKHLVMDTQILMVPNGRDSAITPSRTPTTSSRGSSNARGATHLSKEGTLAN